MNEINLNFIKCFEILSQTLSFSETSKKMNLAQSNVSRQIKLLEESLGVQLFQRTKHQVALTQEGQKFRQELLPLAQQLEEKLSHFKENQLRISGVIKLACFSEVGRLFFAPLCFDFQKRNPEIQCHLFFENEDEILSGVQNGGYEFGILSHPPIVEGITAFPLLKQRIMMVCPPEIKPSNKSQIEKLPFVAYEPSDALLQEIWSKHISKRAKPNLMTCVNSHRSMVEAALKNKLAMVIPSLSIEEELKKGTLVQIQGLEFEAPLYLIYANNEWMPKKNSEFKSFLLKQSKEN